METSGTVCGPVLIRKFEMPKQCDMGIIHAHHHDHTMLIFRGSANVFLTVDGIEGPATLLNAGDTFNVPAETPHRLVTLEDGTEWFCIFSHRDLDGIIVQRYTDAGCTEDAYETIQ